MPATIYNFGIDVFPESATEVQLDPEIFPNLSGNAPYYAVTGQTGNNDVFILVVDVNGGVQFTGLMPYTVAGGNTTGMDIMQIASGNLMILGKRDATPSTSNIFLLELMTNIANSTPYFPIFQIREYYIPNSDVETGYAFVQDEEDNYIIAGTTSERTPNLDDQAFLMEVDHPGLNVNWTHLYEPKSSFVDIAISRNHEGYFMVGDKWEEGNNNIKNIYAVKTDANGAVRGVDCCTPIEVPNTQLGFSYLDPFTTEPVGVPAVAIEFASAYLTPEQMFCQDPPPVDDSFECGWAIATCYAELGAPDVGVIFDTRPNSVAPVGADWNDPALGATKVVDVHPLDWNLDSIGQVFGIAIDNKSNPDGDIFLAATDLYRLDGPWLVGAFGPAGSGGIYKTPGNDLNNTTVFVGTTSIPSSPCALIGNNLIPNTNTLANDAANRGNSIGNIAYDEYNNQLFATNTEDGRIYRIDMTGNILSIYDPFTTGTDVPGIINPSERLWGIGVFEENGVVKVYFARERSGTNDSEIWSIALDGFGEFLGTVNTTCIMQGPEILEITVPSNGEEKVTDIAFSKSCKMLLAERGAPHNARVREYNLISTNWDGPKQYIIGLGGDSSAGGIDYGYVDDGDDTMAGCDSMIWATGNYLQAGSGQLIYGMQGIKDGCNDLANYGNTDLFIDFDQNYVSQEKY
ncbi:MAG: hypothetical protein AAFO82_11140, partial [Bacteroidota bacterium]